MAVYGRKELSRMSIYHMKRLIDTFTAAGHPSIGFIACDEEDQGEYAKSLGIEYFRVPNKPLGVKFSKMFTHALFKETDYVCWVGSNNLHSDEYIQKCIDTLSGDKKVTFGTNKFLVANVSKEHQKTCVFHTRHAMHLCSSMQFYLNYSLSRAVNFRHIYAPDQKFNFDGKINEAIVDKWNVSVVHRISSGDTDCLDLKNSENIHSYESYMKHSPHTYPNGPTRDELGDIYPEIKLLDEGYFDSAPDKTAG